MKTDPQPYVSPGLIAQLFNRAMGFLVGSGLAPGHMYLLEVRGRKTGKLYTTAVDLLAIGNRQYLVAPRGYTQWVRNAEAAGQVRLRRGRQVLEFKLRTVPEADRPAILKEYLDRFRREVQTFFPVPAGSPAAAFVSIAGQYPAFELLPA